MSKDTQKESLNEQKKVVKPKEHKFTKKIEGKKALEHLYKKLDDEGLFQDDPEQGYVLVKDLLSRIGILETEINVLKDLMSRALKIDTNKVLKD